MPRFINEEDGAYEDGWTCPSCTFYNIGADDVCKMCGNNRKFAFTGVDPQTSPKENPLFTNGYIKRYLQDVEKAAAANILKTLCTKKSLQSVWWVDDSGIRNSGMWHKEDELTVRHHVPIELRSNIASAALYYDSLQEFEVMFIPGRISAAPPADSEDSFGAAEVPVAACEMTRVAEAEVVPLNAFVVQPGTELGAELSGESEPLPETPELATILMDFKELLKEAGLRTRGMTGMELVNTVAFVKETDRSLFAGIEEDLVSKAVALWHQLYDHVDTDDEDSDHEADLLGKKISMRGLLKQTSLRSDKSERILVKTEQQSKFSVGQEVEVGGFNYYTRFARFNGRKATIRQMTGNKYVVDIKRADGTGIDVTMTLDAKQLFESHSFKDHITKAMRL